MKTMIWKVTKIMKMRTMKMMMKMGQVFDRYDIDKIKQMILGQLSK
jgi:hypothetical protein